MDGVSSGHVQPHSELSVCEDKTAKQGVVCIMMEWIAGERERESQGCPTKYLAIYPKLMGDNSYAYISGVVGGFFVILHQPLEA